MCHRFFLYIIDKINPSSIKEVCYNSNQLYGPVTFHQCAVPRQLLIQAFSSLGCWICFLFFCQVVKVLNATDEHVMALGANFSLQADSHLVCMQNEQGYKTQAINIQNQARKGTLPLMQLLSYYYFFNVHVYIHLKLVNLVETLFSYLWFP